MLDPTAVAKQFLAQRKNRKSLKRMREMILHMQETAPLEPELVRLRSAVFAIGATGIVREGLKHLKIFNQAIKRIAQTEDDVMPGYPPMSPITDSFFEVWCALGVGLDAAGTRWADVTLSLADTLGLRGDVMNQLHALCHDPCVLGLVKVEHVERNAIVGTELGTGEPRRIYCEPGSFSEGWLVLGYSALDVDGTRQMLTTPYVFTPTEARSWKEYLARALPKKPQERTTSYYQLLRRGPPPLGWMEFIVQAFAGYTELDITLRGVPDRPYSRPHSEQSEQREDARAQARDSAEQDRPATAQPVIALRHAFWDTEEFEMNFHALVDLFAEISEVEELAVEDLDQDLATFLAALALYGTIPEMPRTIDILKPPAGLTDEVHLQTLERMRRAEPALLEIQDVEIDRRVRVKNLITGRSRWIYEKLATRSLKRFDTIFAFVIPAGRHKHEFEGAMAAVPPFVARDIARVVKMAQKLATEEFGPQAAQTIGFLHGMVALDDARRLTVAPEIRNTDGHTLVHAQGRYRVTDCDAARDVLAGLEDAVFVHESYGVYHYNFLSKDNRPQLNGPAVLASIELCQDKLTVHCNSRERLLEFRKVLDHHLADSCSHVADTFEDLEAGSTRSPPIESGETLPPEQARLTAELTENYLFSWLDMEVPVLGGLTPRQAAAKGGALKKQVIRMLKDQELYWERQGLDMPVDFPGAWAQLGARHPSARE